VTTPEIIDQIHEIILKGRQISAKSIAEQLGISREWVGSIIHEDLDMRKLSAKCVPKCLNAVQKRHGAGRIMDETWLYHYDPETKQQSMEWRHSGSPEKMSSTIIRWKSFRLDFFETKTASFSLSIFQRAKLSTRSITHLCWCNWRTFWRKNAAGRSKGGLILARQSTVSPGTCNPEETGLPGLPMS